MCVSGWFDWVCVVNGVEMVRVMVMVGIRCFMIGIFMILVNCSVLFVEVLGDIEISVGLGGGVKNVIVFNVVFCFW